jgi:ribosomal protein S18 acetylase RimI-like enzyme
MLSHSAFEYIAKSRHRLLFRTVLADDKSRIKAGFSLLSEQSRYMRFFTYLKELSEKQLNYLSNPDQINHVAWGALDLNVDENIGIGIGRFIRLEEEPNCAELAITVIDAYQGQGIGNILFAILYLQAKPHQIDYFVGSVMPSNYYVLHKLRAMNAKIRYDGNVYQFKIPICDELVNCLGDESVKKFKQTLVEVEKLLSENNSTTENQI